MFVMREREMEKKKNKELVENKIGEEKENKEKE